MFAWQTLPSNWPVFFLFLFLSNLNFSSKDFKFFLRPSPVLPLSEKVLHPFLCSLLTLLNRFLLFCVLLFFCVCLDIFVFLLYQYCCFCVIVVVLIVCVFLFFFRLLIINVFCSFCGYFLSGFCVLLVLFMFMLSNMIL